VTTAFFVVSIVGLALTVNAWWPLRSPAVMLPAFFTSWLTKELAPHNLVVHIGLTSWFVSAGAAHGSKGLAALAFSAFSAGGLVGLIVESHNARDVVERAIRETLGEDYITCIVSPRSPEYDLRVPWRQLLLPFHMTHPDVKRIRNLSYGPYGKRNLLDVYHHKDRPAGCPVLLQIHGGAWQIENKDHQGRPMMLHFASRGWVCFAPNYRLSPRATWPDHLVDLKRAIAWIREHAHEYGGDPGFIVVTGGSAGGHLAAMLALTANDPELQPEFEDADTTVQAAVPYYGLYDFTVGGSMHDRQFVRMLERFVMKKKLATHREEFEKASPIYRISPDAPPFFVIHGAHDLLAPAKYTRRFVERLREVSRSPVVYAELPGTQHAFDVFPSIRTAHVIRGVERFADYVYCMRSAELTRANGARQARRSTPARRSPTSRR
jgi:acetyl esterase/lipase